LHSFCRAKSQAAGELGSNADKGWQYFNFRWYNHLNPAIIKDKELNRSEIDKLFELQNKMGNKWAIIAK